MFEHELLPYPTGRLILRRFAESDLPHFVAYRNDPSVARYQSWSILSPEEALRFIQEVQVAALGVPGEWNQIAIAQRENDTLVGDIGMCVDPTDATRAELGFTLSRAAQGKGYAAEAVQAWIDLLFNCTALTSIFAIADSRNSPSRKLLERVGMQVRRIDEREFKGELCLEETFELTREHWQAQEGLARE